MEKRIVCVDRAAFAHGEVVRRIETGGSEVADGSGFAHDSVNFDFGTERVAVVLHKPEVVEFAELFDLDDIEGVAEGVGDHHGFGFFRIRGFQLSNVDIVLRNGNVDEHRNRAELDDWRDGCRESRGNGDDFVSAADSAFTEFVCGECGEREQVCGGSGVADGAEFYSELLCKTFFEPCGPGPRGEPEVESGINEVHDLFFIEEASAVIDPGFARNERCGSAEAQFCIFADGVQNVLFQLLMFHRIAPLKKAPEDSVSVRSLGWQIKLDYAAFSFCGALSFMR